jgi:hypothetical protein
MPRRSPSRRTRPAPTPARRSPSGGLVVGLIVAGLTLAAVVILAARAISPAAATPELAPTSAPADAAPTVTDACRTMPVFTANPALSAEGGMALATDQPQMGLVLLATRRPDQYYQHDTWSDAGFLGAIAYDREGNIYVAPTPRLSLADNPLEGATTLWRVDSVSGEMAPFVTLPGAASERNPFGVLGLSYVCDLHRLYAGHVIGSTPTDELGGVVAVDLSSGALTPVLEATDVMGLLVVRVGAGYELYMGLARSPEVLALPLDARGAPSGPVRLLLDLTEAGATPSERARKLRLVEGELVADLVPFNYSLQTSAAAEPNRIATWSFDLATSAWQVSRRATGP